MDVFCDLIKTMGVEQEKGRVMFAELDEKLVSEIIVDCYREILNSLGYSKFASREEELLADGILEVLRGELSGSAFARRVSAGRVFGRLGCGVEYLPALYTRVLQRLSALLLEKKLDCERTRLVVDELIKRLGLDMSLTIIGYRDAVLADGEPLYQVDPLTGLCNRIQFERKFYNLLSYSRLEGEHLCLVIVDIDGMRLINNIYGYPVGDLAIRALVETMREAVPGADLMARMGGDELGVVLCGVNLKEGLHCGEEIRRRVGEIRLRPGGDEVHLTASVGVAEYPCHGEGVEDLISAAELAVIRAKRLGRDRVETIQHGRGPEEVALLHERVVYLRERLREKDCIIPYFQPIVNLESGDVLGYEVLARIQDGDKVIPAALFIEAAEYGGLMSEVDNEVLFKAFRAKRESGLTGKKLFINISMREVERGDILKRLEKMALFHDIDLKDVVVEVTEREALKDTARARDFTEDLHKRGMQMAIDDFGSGFSSFWYLWMFECQYVKIEGSLVKEICNNEKSRLIVEHIVGLAKSMGVEPVAEFVENKEIMEALLEMGVKYGQGYYLGRPSPKLVGEVRDI